MSEAHDAVPTPNARLHTRFAEWKLRYDSTVTPELQKYPLYSSAWEDLWHHVWAEYDELENARITKGLAKQSWQDAMDNERISGESMRKHRSDSDELTASDWMEAPLGALLERLLGPISCIRGNDVALALKRWDVFREVMAEQHELSGSLSVSQKASWNILNQWWSGTYQDPSLSDAARVSLQEIASSQVRPVYFFDEPYLNAAASAQGRRSVYNSMMLSLFNHEFNPDQWDPYFRGIWLTSLKVQRTKGVQHANAQRLAYTSYQRLRGLTVNDAGSYMSSLDRPCPWLPPAGDHKEMPYFLWDVEQRCTVRVEDLVGEPDYYCVSHTWGRWRKEAIHISGVPWLVPQNERFDIEKLPEHLQQLRSRSRFIWIDLFCIPQDGSPKADEEINRQASIFQNASHCIAWINDASEWKKTAMALDWLAISYLHATTSAGVYDTHELLQTLRNDAKDTSELFTAPYHIGDPVDQLPANLLDESGRRTVISINSETLAEPVCWFSSLWTLQEAMLCPDITFVTRDWVSLNDRSGVPIPLNTFCGFLDIVESVWFDGMPYKTYTKGPIVRFSTHNYQAQSEDQRYLQWPDGPRQLIDLCLITRMDNLLASPSPVGLLMAANIRQCTGSRAPAIMSALGVTEWYKSDVKSDKDLVLNCYPLAFVREAALKLGASFYESSAKKPTIPPRPYDIISGSCKGSMMPFSATSGWFSRIVGIVEQHRYKPVDHPAVYSWTIRHDGCVEIKQAGIIVSTETSNPDTRVMDLHIVGSESQSRYICSFGDWAKTLPRGMCAYAVSLLHGSERQHGLVLQGIRKSWFSTQRLIKVGHFMVQNLDLPPITNVNWVVW